MARLCLVLGASGMVGSHLVERLVASGDRVRIVTRQSDLQWLKDVQENIEVIIGDISDEQICKEAVVGVDVLFHCASYRNNIALHTTKFSEVCTANILLSATMLKALHTNPIPKIVFISTANITPDQSLVTDFSATIDGYTLGKLYSEQLWQLYGKQTGSTVIIARPVSIYGPRDRFTPNSNVVPALITRAFAAQDTLTVWGTGAQTRPFVYIDDVVASLLLLDKQATAGVYYSSSPIATSIDSLAQMIVESVNPRLQIVYDATKPDGYSVAVPPLNPVFANFAWTPLQNGIQQTVQFYTHSIAAQ